MRLLVDYHINTKLASVYSIKIVKYKKAKDLLQVIGAQRKKLKYTIKRTETVWKNLDDDVEELR